jgi:hypothetical protein
MHHCVPKNVANTTNFVSPLHVYNLRHYVKVWYSLKYFVPFFMITNCGMANHTCCCYCVEIFFLNLCSDTRLNNVAISLIFLHHSKTKPHLSSILIFIHGSYTQLSWGNGDIYQFFLSWHHVCPCLIILRSSHTWSDIVHSLSERTEFCYQCLLSYT